MKYMLLMYANEAGIPQSPEEQRAAAPVWSALSEEMKAAGVWVASSGLSPVADAMTVRIRNGKTLTIDGPFAETQEQMGGYYLVEARDLNEAIGIAARIPSVRFGTIEVRPVMDVGAPS